MKIIGEVKDIPEDITIVNDLSIAGLSEDFGRKEDYLKLLEGKKISEGGLLPEDNVRIYVPIDISQELILSRLSSLLCKLGEVTWSNEMDYSVQVSNLITLIELYDQSLIEQGNFPVVQTGEAIHSKLAIDMTFLSDRFPFFRRFLKHATQFFLHHRHLYNLLRKALLPLAPEGAG